jgi:hypothetical protein
MSSERILWAYQKTRRKIERRELIRIFERP